ncbi:MAG: putative ABC transporter permease [Lachnospiraceae bacterium]|nr:putative ABC transporter permease [Lachnospiraceae bacterium]
MWEIKMFGTDLYHLVAAFVIYSMLGWLVESIYMSFCNHKITNRGFAKSPFCPIYGFGAVIGYLVLCPLRKQYVLLYFVAAFLATTFEFLVGKLMIRLFGELWWDYNDKPFNYKGIICLESTIAWGFYGLGIVCFLHAKIYSFIDRISPEIGIRIISVILLIVLVDYIIQLLKAFKVDLSKPREAIVERYKSFRAR